MRNLSEVRIVNTAYEASKTHYCCEVIMSQIKGEKRATRIMFLN